MISVRARVLTAQHIAKLPLHNLKRYRHSVQLSRRELHDSLYEYRWHDKGYEFKLGKREATEEEVVWIKTLDWLIARCNEQYEVKKRK